MKKTAVIVGANGNLGSAVVGAFYEKDYVIDQTWIGKDRPCATKEASYRNLPDRVNCGVYVSGINAVMPFSKLSSYGWDRVIDVNLKGAFLFAKAVLPKLVDSGGTLVFISSIMATHPYPHRSPYAASKAALEALARSLAVEYGDCGVSVFAIRLGHLEGLMKSTNVNPVLLDAVREKTPSGKLIDPKDVAEFIVFLSETGQRFMNGTVIECDPGYTINRNPLV